ncbi:Maintenance of ploidy protein mob2 [Scheffersomyces spartinae]|uniref:Maintenance of ploidy protein mob2 n=1 Tax=Scheffersomyces spartinae TaxID=45513 RepID=A0A9P7VDC8_9ASCO|nr:Maintenance of ploidy protein mob2 [Scheffersomyces spartinae]KAG7195755.1 Maintenance of ploidy protein mob2 [Scheffersomyces spartinae]
MSFFNSIRGFGRSSKKSKKELETANPFYTSSPSNASRRSNSPTKLSPSKQQRLTNQIQFSNQVSPTKKRLSVQLNPPAVHKRSTTSYPPPLFMCEPFIKTALVKGSFRTIIQLPKYVDFGEWLALNIFEMFNNLNQFYGVLAEYTTPDLYPTMNAGPNINYLWIDGSGQPVDLPANQYIDLVMTWILSKLNDQAVFPTKNGGAFPPNFVKDCKNISRQMFRVFAFVYYNHFERILHLSLEAHWNSFFAHFVSFVKEFSLIERKEMDPLLPLIENLELQGKII